MPAISPRVILRPSNSATTEAPPAELAVLDVSGFKSVMFDLAWEASTLRPRVSRQATMRLPNWFSKVLSGYSALITANLAKAALGSIRFSCWITPIW